MFSLDLHKCKLCNHHIKAENIENGNFEFSKFLETTPLFPHNENEYNQSNVIFLFTNISFAKLYFYPFKLFVLFKLMS